MEIIKKEVVIDTAEEHQAKVSFVVHLVIDEQVLEKSEEIARLKSMSLEGYFAHLIEKFNETEYWEILYEQKQQAKKEKKGQKEERKRIRALKSWKRKTG